MPTYYVSVYVLTFNKVQDVCAIRVLYTCGNGVSGNLPQGKSAANMMDCAPYTHYYVVDTVYAFLVSERQVSVIFVNHEYIWVQWCDTCIIKPTLSFVLREVIDWTNADI